MIYGGDDVVVVVDMLVKVNVFVIISLMVNLLGSFDLLYVNFVNVGKFEKVGVKVIIGVVGDFSYNVY